MDEMIKIKLIAEEQEINAEAFIEPSAYHYLDRLAQKETLSLETFLVAQLAKNVKMADCMGKLYILPQSTDVF